MKKILAVLLTALSQHCLASNNVVLPPQPTPCIQASFSNSGGSWWKTIYLKLTNNCGQNIDFQNATVTFQNASNVNTTFWGNFNPISYPDNNLVITSQAQSSGNYLASFNLHFPTTAGSNSKLPNGQSITIIYGAAKADYINNTANVYVSTPVSTGEIDLSNTSAQPANTSQPYSIIHLTYNNQPLSDVQVPWLGSLKLTNLAAGSYTISPASITDTNANIYSGIATPSVITLASNQILASSISYSLTQPSGSITFKVQALPSELSGYASNPALVLTNTSDNSATNLTANWNISTTASKLASGKTYTFTSPIIAYNGYNCAPTFNPTTAIASTTAPIVNLTYICTQATQDTVAINVNGLSSSTSSIVATFTPNNNSTAVTQTISLTNGSGSSSVKLTDGTVYTVTSTTVNGYNISYNPQPLTSTANATETITYSNTATAGGRIIGYLPGWKTPPSATALHDAGYTHILVAFGVFSTATPGQITPAFDTVTANYIKSLQSQGIKVLLSLGGASTSIPNTSVSFHQVLSAASSPDVFTQTFIQSLENLVTQYGFDGFDIDVEHGITAGGTFSNPQGDIAVLANILNTYHSKHPLSLLTLAPQTANISATSGFSEIWGNYASLIMQSYNALEWVGVQLYNTGCMFGIDQVCYDPNATSSPNFSVAMATDMLANWPTSLGFQPYISYLKPSQVVIGYPAPDAQGNADGGPITPATTIKRSVQCLRTAVKGANSCDTYVPPKAYPGIGGVFNWEVNYDQSNSFKFATGLKDCVINGNC